ncbi:MAG: UDP-N-acetylglucosamine 2-epimerase (non-hydrolyzing) [Acidobacteriia bacterium]|nr:UDP-N-acetylglucosamine 2-epimerase (non-hydrolyzing) [Terriglobia bacterium]
MRIVNVVGTRPNLVKIAPLMAEMRKFPEIDAVLVHTGQHYDENMSRVFFRDLGIPEPHHNLEIGSGSGTWQTARVMLVLESLLRELKPDLVVVVGDVNSTLAGALVSSRLRVPLAHVEAGLRSFDRTMPEEINRILTDAIADYLFTTEKSANDNLRREGIADAKVFFVGNVMVDTLLLHQDRARKLDMAARFKLPDKSYAVLTLHRPSNVDRPEVMEGFCEIMERVQEQLPLIFPVHPRTRARLTEHGLLPRLQGMKKLKLVEPLGYLEFLGLMAQAQLLLTDSGGIQEEATILGVPCVTLRENTERPVTVELGMNRIAGTRPSRVLQVVREVLGKKMKNGVLPEFWDGKAAARIVNVLLNQKTPQPEA